jgi:hypothetical protein
MRHTHQKRRNEREGHVERCKTTQEKQEQRERRDGENMQRMREAEASSSQGALHAQCALPFPSQSGSSNGRDSCEYKK